MDARALVNARIACLETDQIQGGTLDDALLASRVADGHLSDAEVDEIYWSDPVAVDAYLDPAKANGPAALREAVAIYLIGGLYGNARDSGQMAEEAFRKVRDEMLEEQGCPTDPHSIAVIEKAAREIAERPTVGAACPDCGKPGTDEPGEGCASTWHWDLIQGEGETH